MRLNITPSTGNVFRDLGFRREEAEHLLIRADLMIQVQKIIKSRRLKQNATAKILRVTQPRVSDLLRGRIDLFSTDALIASIGSTRSAGSRTNRERQVGGYARLRATPSGARSPGSLVVQNPSSVLGLHPRLGRLVSATTPRCQSSCRPLGPRRRRSTVAFTCGRASECEPGRQVTCVARRGQAVIAESRQHTGIRIFARLHG